jgi:AraC family transcriptional regulator
VGCDVTVKVAAILTPDNVARWCGFNPDRKMTSRWEQVSAAIWRFPRAGIYEVRGHADENTDAILMPVAGRHHHTYFGDGRQRWAGKHQPFHMNIVVAGQSPRGILESEQPFKYLHVYVPHTMIESVAADCGLGEASGRVALIDPMCSRDPQVESVCRQILHEMSELDACSRLALDCLGQELAIRLLREHSNVSNLMRQGARPGRGYRDWRLGSAMEYLEAHLGEDVGLSSVAATVGVSATHLANLFRDGAGQPPHRWLMSRRLERACELLAKPHLGVADIALQCGFASPQHLATVMRRRMATTPTAYRRALLA